MNTLQPIIIILLIALLGACAKPLQTDDYESRISATRLGTDSFIVSYSAQVTDEKVVDLALLRSAELSLQNGFNYFIIVETEKSAANYATAESSDATKFTLHNGLRLQHSDPGTTNTIVCFKRKPPGFAYVALLVKASLRAKYDLDQPAQLI
jgi:hypothetical protein